RSCYWLLGASCYSGVKLPRSRVQGFLLLAACFLLLADPETSSQEPVTRDQRPVARDQKSED
ncbi:MAG: hypothetical protein V3V51_05875, partial [Desulfobacterales bacterium]